MLIFPAHSNILSEIRPLFPASSLSRVKKDPSLSPVSPKISASGWIGGGFGVGKRISLTYTRKMVDAIHDGTLRDAEYEEMPVFDLNVPKQVGRRKEESFCFN